jgi:hypothetical protein
MSASSRPEISFFAKQTQSTGNHLRQHAAGEYWEYDFVVALDDATSGINPALGRMSKARAIASKARGQLQL